MSTHRTEHQLQLPISQEDLTAADTSLAVTIIRELLAKPKPSPDEWGISPFKELWVQFTPEGSDAPPIPSELDSDDFSQTWLNALSLIRPSERFLQDFQDSLQQTLRWLFESTEHFPQQDAITIRIVAS